MSLGDDLAAALPELRALAESRMVDTCVITRAGSGRGRWNPETRDYDPAPRTTIYTGKCEVQERDMQERDALAGEADIDMQRYLVKLPVEGSEGVRPDDDVEMTSGAHDPDLLGKHMTVRGSHHKTFATARRLPCVEVV